MRAAPKTIMSSLTLLVFGLSLRASLPSHSAALAPVGVVGDPAGTRSIATAPKNMASRSASPRATATAPPASHATATPRTVHSSAPAVRHTSKPTVAPKPATYTVNGGSADTQYGPVQVQIRIRSGRIISADAIDYPQGSGRDQEINSYAIPQLDQETLDAQSAQIDTVSGATYTSDGYRESLQSALDAAHQAGLL
jgi:uncharacterized protein with FMN-binding domain